jgi:gas vesicle protein
MKEELVKTERSIWLPFLVGSVVGAGVALLLAPKSGRALRQDIRDSASSARGRITATVEKGRNMYGEGVTAIKGALDAGKRAFTEEREKHLKRAA